MNPDYEQLISFLEEAGRLLTRSGQKKISNTEYHADELGAFCSGIGPKILNSTITIEEQKKLYDVFSPGSAWYRAVDDIVLGHSIYELVGELYFSA